MCLLHNTEEKLRTSEAVPEKGNEKIERFRENILGVPVVWAINSLSKTFIDGLGNADHFPRSLCDYPTTSIDIMKKSGTALLQFGDELNDIQTENKKNIETITGYIESYYAKRAPVEDAARMLYALDRDEDIVSVSSTLHETVKAKLRSLREDVAHGGNEARQAKVADWLKNLNDAQDAAKYIAGRELPAMNHMAKLMGESDEEQDLDEEDDDEPGESKEYFTDPRKWILNRPPDVKVIAGFKQVMHELQESGELGRDDELEKAFFTINSFTDRMLTLHHHSYGGKSVAEEIAEQQKEFANIDSAGIVETKLPGCKGLKDIVVESYTASGVIDMPPLIDLLITIHSNPASDPDITRHIDNIDRWLKEQLSRGLHYETGYVLIDIEERLASKSPLDDKARAALEAVKERIEQRDREHPERRLSLTQPSIEKQHWIEGGRTKEEYPSDFSRTLMYCRVENANKALEGITGLEGMDDKVQEMEYKWEQSRFHNHTSSYSDFVYQTNNTIKEAARWKVILQGIVKEEGERTDAAQHVIRYLDACYSAAGQEKDFKAYVTEFEPLWEDAVAAGVSGQFLRALDEPSAAAPLIGKGSGPMSRYLYGLYESDGQLPKLSTAMVDPTPLPPFNVASQLSKAQIQFSDTQNLITKMERVPDTVLWDTAKWLAEAEKYSNSVERGIVTNGLLPHLEMVTEYIKSAFSSTNHDVIALGHEMCAALEAENHFDTNSHMLNILCKDSPSLKAGEIAKCGYLAMRMEQEISDGGNRKAAAETALPFLKKALAHAGLKDEVHRYRRRVERIVEMSDRVGFANDEDLADKKELRSNLGYGYRTAKIIAVANNMLEEMREGTRELTGGQIHSLNQLRKHVGSFVNAYGHREGFAMAIGRERTKIALAYINAASEQLPELQAIKTPDGTPVDVKDTYELEEHYRDEVPYLEERYLIAVQNALSSGRILPAGLQRHLRTVEDYIQTEFQKNDAFIRSAHFGEEHTHASTIERLRGQQGSAQTARGGGTK